MLRFYGAVGFLFSGMRNTRGGLSLLVEYYTPISSPLRILH